MARVTSEEDRWLATAFVAASVLLPIAFAASHAMAVTDTAHDLEVARVLGLESTGGFRALDAFIAAPFVLSPFGDRALAASLSSAAIVGVLGLVLFESVRARALRTSPTLVAYVAFVTSAIATLAPATQMEASTVGGATLGALLALLPRALHARYHSITRVAFALGLAVAYEPLVGVCALASLVPSRALFDRARHDAVRAIGSIVAGFVPLVASILMRRSTDFDSKPFARVWGEGWGARAPFIPALITEVGIVVIGLAVGGLALTATRRPSRSAAVSSVLVLAISCSAINLGCALGPARWSPLVLVAICEVALVASTGMLALLTFVRETRVPFAKASAWLAGVVLLAIVARQADDASLRLGKRTGEPERAFARYAWDAIPLGAVVLVADPDVALHLASARAQGDVRSDVAFVRLGAFGAMNDVAREPKLAPLLRDQALYGSPEEWSLSALAASRPLVLGFDARWPRSLARHLVSVGAFDRFYSEPRGLSDRRLALLAQEPSRLALVYALERSPDPELARVTATLLRLRLLGAAASTDRDVIGTALDDLRPFAPADPTAFEIVRRLTLKSGPIDLSDLGR